MASNDQITNQQEGITRDKSSTQMYSTNLNAIPGVNEAPVLSKTDEYQKNLAESTARLQMAGLTQAQIDAQTQQAETNPGWFEHYIISPLTAPLRFVEGGVAGSTASIRDVFGDNDAYESLWDDPRDRGKNVFSNTWRSAVNSWQKDYLSSGQRLTGDNLMKFMVTGNPDTTDWSFWAKLGASLPADIFLDPLTYLGMPLFKGASKGIKYGSKEVGKAFEGLTPTFRAAKEATGLSSKALREEVDNALMELAKVRNPDFETNFNQLLKSKRKITSKEFEKFEKQSQVEMYKELKRYISAEDRVNELRRLAGEDFSKLNVANQAEKDLSRFSNLTHETSNLVKKLTGNSNAGIKLVRDEKNASLRKMKSIESQLTKEVTQYGRDGKKIVDNLLKNENWEYDLTRILKGSNKFLSDLNISRIIEDLKSSSKSIRSRGRADVVAALDRIAGNKIASEPTYLRHDIFKRIIENNPKGNWGEFTKFDISANEMQRLLNDLTDFVPTRKQALDSIIVKEFNPEKYTSVAKGNVPNYSPDNINIEEILPKLDQYGRDIIEPLTKEQIVNIEDKLYAIMVTGDLRKNLKQFLRIVGQSNPNPKTMAKLAENTRLWNTAIEKSYTPRKSTLPIKEIKKHLLEFKRPELDKLFKNKSDLQSFYNTFGTKPLFMDKELEKSLFSEPKKIAPLVKNAEDALKENTQFIKSSFDKLENFKNENIAKLLKEQSDKAAKKFEQLSKRYRKVVNKETIDDFFTRSIADNLLPEQKIINDAFAAKLLANKKTTIPREIKGPYKRITEKIPHTLEEIKKLPDLEQYQILNENIFKFLEDSKYKGFPAQKRDALAKEAKVKIRPAKKVGSDRYYTSYNNEDLIKMIEHHNIPITTQRKNIIRKYLKDIEAEEKLAKLERETNPKSVVDILNNWDLINKSPYSNSFYNAGDISWNSKPEGSLRLADHWNFESMGSKHAETYEDVKNGVYSLGQYKDGKYNILKTDIPKGFSGVGQQDGKLTLYNNVFEKYFKNGKLRENPLKTSKLVLNKPLHNVIDEIPKVEKQVQKITKELVKPTNTKTSLISKDVNQELKDLGITLPSTKKIAPLIKESGSLPSDWARNLIAKELKNKDLLTSTGTIKKSALEDLGLSKEVIPKVEKQIFEPLKEIPKEEVSKVVEPLKEDVAKLKFTINDDEGMHYRPSAILSSEANKFKSDINFLWNGENVNAKSILSIAKQNIKNGQELEILAKGTDSVNAIKSIEQRLSEESKFFQNISTNLEKGTEVSPTELVDRPINVADYNYSVNEAYNLLNENWKNYEKFIKENNLNGLKGYEILGTEHAKEYSKITSFGDMLQEELEHSLPKIITQNTTKSFLKTVDLDKMSTDELYKIWQKKVEKIPSIKSTHWMHQGDEYRISDKGILSKRAKYSDKYHQIATNKFNSIEDAKTYVNEFFNPIKEEKVLNTTNPEIQLLLDNKDITQKYTKYSKEEWDKFSLEEKNNIINNLSDWEVSKIIESPSFRKIWELANPLPFKSPLNVSNLPELSENQLYNIINDRFKQMYDQYIFMDAKSTPPLLKEYRNILDTFTYDQLNQVSEKLGLGKFFENYSTSGIENYARFNKLNNLENISLNKLFIKNKDKIFEDLKIPKGTSLESLNETQIDQIYKKLDKLLSETEQFKKNIDNLMQGGSRRAAYANFKSSPTHLYVPKELPKDFDTFIKTLKKEAKNWNVKDLEKRYNLKYDSSKKQIPSLEHAKRRNGIGLTFKDKNGNYISIAEDGTATKGGSNGSTIKNFLGKVITLEGDPFFNPGKELPLTFKNKYIKELDQKMNDLFPELNLLKETPKVIEQAPQVINTINEDLLKEIEKFNFKTFNKPTTQTIDKYTAMVSGKQPKTSRNVSIKNEQHLSNDAIKELSDKLNLKINNITSKDVPNFISPETLGDILDLEYLGFSPKQMDWYFKDAENNILRIIKDYKNDWKPLLKGKSLSDFNIPSEFFTKLNVDSNLLPIDYLIRGKSNPLLNNLKDVSYLNEVIGDSVKMNNLDVLDLFNKSYTPKETSKVLDSVKEVLPKAIEDKPVITPDRIKAALARVNKKLNVPEGPKFGIKVPNLSTKPSDFLTKPMIQNKFNVLVDDFINTKTNTAVYLKDKLGNNIRISDKLRNTTFDTPTSPKYKELILPENAFNKKGKMPLINKAYSKDISSFLDNLSPTINQEPIPKIISLSEDVGTKVEEEFITDELPKEIIQAADNGDIPTQVAKDIQKKLPKRLPRDLQKAILEQSNKDIDSFLQSASTADLIDKLGIKNKTKILDKQKIHQEEIGSPTANLTNPEREQFNKFMSDTHGMKLKEKYIQLNPSMRDKLSQEGYLTKVEQANLRKFYQQEYDLAKEFETWIGDPKVFEKIDARFKSTYPKIRAKMNKDLPLSKSELVKLNKFNLDEFNSTKRFEEYIKNADNLKELHKEVFKLNKNIEEKLKLKLPILPEEGKAFQEELYQTFKKLDKKNKMFIFNKPLRVSKTIPQESFNKMESYLNNFYTFGGTSNLEKIAQQKEVMDILNKVGFQEMVSRGRDIANTPLLQLEQLSVSPERTLNEFLYQKGIKNNLLGDREKVYLKNMVTEEVSKVLRGGGTKGKVNDILNREALANKAFATPKYVGTAQGISEKIGFQEFPFFENSLLMRALKTNSEIKNIYKFDKGLIMALKTGAIRTGSSIPDKYAFLYRQIDSSKFNKILESMSKNNPSGFDTYVQLFNKENLHLKLDTSTPGKLIFRGADGLPMMDSINIQRNVDNLLSDSKMSLTNGDLTEIGKGYDAMMRGLKSGMLYSLGYLTRVFFGNITQHILAGGAFREFVRDIERGTKELPKYRNISEDLARARVEARKYLPENTLSRNITDLNNKIVDVNSTLHKQLMDGGFKFNKSFKSMEEVKQVYDNLFEIIELGVLEDVYFGSVRSKLAKAASYGTTSDIKKALNTTFWDQHENIGKMGKMAAKWPVKATIWTTDSTRLGAYLNLLDDPARLSKYGMQLTKKGASDWVKTAYFDIMKLSDFEEKYFARLIPFYRFWRLSVEQNIRNLATLNLEPYRKINKIISEAWLQTGAFDEGGEGFNQIPGFALTQAWMPVHVNEETGKVTTLKYGYTPSTLFNLISNPSSNMAAELFSMGNPIIKAFTEMAFQRNLYTGQTYDKPVEQALNQNLNPFGTRRRSRQASRERATEMGDKNFLLDNLSSIFYSYSTEKQIEYYLQNKISLLNELMRSMEAQGYFIPYFDQVDSAIFKVPELFGSEI